MKDESLEKQLRSVIKQFDALKARTPHNDLSDLPKHERQALVTKAISAISRTGEKSTYSKELDRVLKILPQLHEHTTSVIGVAKALLEDLEAGYVQSLVELIHGEVFGDFLEMAQHLCESAYKDAAAVIAGSALESHLRELCRKSGISVEVHKAGGVGPKKADLMNADLAAAGVYSKLDQKNVTAWLDLRNKAAHGKYTEYNQDQVLLLISSVRDFIARNPA